MVLYSAVEGEQSMSPVQIKIPVWVSSPSSSSSSLQFLLRNSQDENVNPLPREVQRNETNVENERSFQENPSARNYKSIFEQLDSVTVGNNGCNGDDDLTSLAWLQDANLLKNIGRTTSPCQQNAPRRLKELTNCDEDAPVGLPLRERRPFDRARREAAFEKRRGLKPRLSFNILIFMALENSPEKVLPVKDIYDWIEKYFPYFKDARPGWKNSIRHNLSFNRYFKNICSFNLSGTRKNSQWYVDPKYKQTLRKSLFKSNLDWLPDDTLVCFGHLPQDSPERKYEEVEEDCNVDMDVASTLANLSNLIGREASQPDSTTTEDDDESADLTLQGGFAGVSTLDQDGENSTSINGVESELLEKHLKWKENGGGEAKMLKSSLIGRETTNDCNPNRGNVNDKSRTIEGINALLGLASAMD